MRTYAFIDGFNLYHALIGEKATQTRALAKYRWLNLTGVVSDFLEKDDSLDAILYFTAHAFWDSSKVGRHKTYIRALETVGVGTILGKFYEVEKTCRSCGGDYFTREEKQSDVNLATHILHYAHLDKYDKAIVVTGDSDICPSIKIVKATFPAKHVKVLIPPARKAEEIRKVSDSHHEITEDCLKRNQFPGILTDTRGMFYVPPGWA